MSGPGPEPIKVDKPSAGASKSGGGDAKVDGGSKTSQRARDAQAGKSVDEAAAAAAPGGAVEKSLEVFPTIPGLDIDRALKLARLVSMNAKELGNALAAAKSATEPEDALKALYRAESEALNGRHALDVLNGAIPGGIKDAFKNLNDPESIPPKLGAALRAISSATKRTADLAKNAEIPEFGIIQSMLLQAKGLTTSTTRIGKRVKTAMHDFENALGEAGTPLTLLIDAVSALNERNASAEREAFRKRRNDEAAAKAAAAAASAGGAPSKEPPSKVVEAAATKEAAAKEPSIEGVESHGSAGRTSKLGTTFSLTPKHIRGSLISVSLFYQESGEYKTAPILPKLWVESPKTLRDDSHPTRAKVLKAVKKELLGHVYDQALIDNAVNDFMPVLALLLEQTSEPGYDASVGL